MTLINIEEAVQYLQRLSWYKVIENYRIIMSMQYKVPEDRIILQHPHFHSISISLHAQTPFTFENTNCVFCPCSCSTVTARYPTGLSPTQVHIYVCKHSDVLSYALRLRSALGSVPAVLPRSWFQETDGWAYARL